MMFKNFMHFNFRQISFFTIITALLLMAAPICPASESIVQTKIPLRVKNVHIQDLDIRIPIPPGYEEMKREDNPEKYDWLLSASSVMNNIPLAVFINSEDRKNLLGHKSDAFRAAIIFFENSIKEFIVSDDTREQFLDKLSEFDFTIWDMTNNTFQIPSSQTYNYYCVHRGEKSLSNVIIVKIGEMNDEKYTLTHSYMIPDTKIISVKFYLMNYENEDAAFPSILHDTKVYMKDIDKNNY